MIHVEFNPNDLQGDQKTWWEGWLTEAELATKAIIDEWETKRKTVVTKEELKKLKLTFNEEVWKKLRDWLLDNVFHDKCAYCETRVVREDYHAEHFRPKGAVKFKVENKIHLGKAIVKDEMADDLVAREQEIDHPGYFWLAYHWRNLLPSCPLCNKGGGKNNQFPVKRSHLAIRRLQDTDIQDLDDPRIESLTVKKIFYLQPQDLDKREDPLLLHPYDKGENDPRKHIRFGAGIAAPIEDASGTPSEKGKHSIAVYNLNEERLIADRLSRQKNVWTLYLTRIAGAQGVESEIKKVVTEVLTPYIEGKEPYSAAVLDYLEKTIPQGPLNPYYWLNQPPGPQD
jgi:hypothetical protein